MYKLKIYLDTDGDFGHASSDFNGNEAIWVYEDDARLTAIHRLNFFYSTLIKSINNYDDYFNSKVQMLYDFKDYLNLITKKYETFDIEFRLGNPTFSIEFTKMNIVEVKHGYFVKNINPKLTLYINESFKTDFNWDAINNLPNLHEECNIDKII